MRIFLLFIFFITVNCSGNKVTNYHGAKLLEEKFNEIQINISNKNDLINIIGPPSTVSDFNPNKWFYIERLKTNQSLFKLGNQVIKKNNILIVELNEKGILKNKNLLNLDNMNDIKYLKNVTAKDFKKKDKILSGVLSSFREKINAPMRNR
mgnify:FL=1